MKPFAEPSSLAESELSDGCIWSSILVTQKVGQRSITQSISCRLHENLSINSCGLVGSGHSNLVFNPFASKTQFSQFHINMIRVEYFDCNNIPCDI